MVCYFALSILNHESIYLGGNMKFLILILLIPVSICSKLFYVSPQGNNNNPGTFEKPWRDISFATCGGTYKCPCTKANNHIIQQGDTLYLFKGVYNENNINISNSGTVSCPIVIRNYPGHDVTIDGGYNAPVIYLGVYNPTSNIVIKGLSIKRGLTAGIYTGASYACRNIVIDSCSITDVKIVDNTACVYISNTSDSITVKNCYLNMGRPDSSRGAGVEIFTGGNNHVIENNEITGSLKGIYYKHGINGGNNHTIIRNNYIHDIHNDYAAAGIAISTDNIIITNNLLVNNDNPIKIFDGEPTTCDHVGAFYGLIDHNTIVNNKIKVEISSINLGEPQNCLERGARYTTVTNNLVIGDNLILNIWHYKPTDSIGHRTISDYNLFFSLALNTFNEYKKNYSFPSFSLQTGMDKHSIFKHNLNSDYSLKENSPGYHASADGSDMGANISNIGLNKNPNPNPNPNPNSNPPKRCGCGSGTGLAFLPPIFFKFKNKLFGEKMKSR